MAFTEKDRERSVEQGELLAKMHTIVTENLLPASKDHEIRIRSVEKNQFKSMGANSVLSALIAGATAWFTGHQ